jgi:enterobacterial common antigen flippase
VTSVRAPASGTETVYPGVETPGGVTNADGPGTGRIFWHKVAETSATQAGLIMLGVVMAVLTARVLGAEGRGLFAVMLAIAAFGVQFGNVGLSSSVAYLAALQPDSRRQLLGLTIIGGLLAGSTVATLFLLVTLGMPALAPLPPALLLPAALSIPAALLLLLTLQFLLGSNRVRLYNVLQLAKEAAVLIALVAAVVLGARGVMPYFWVWLAGVGAAAAAALWVAVRGEGAPVAPGIDLLSRALGYGGRAYLAMLFSYAVLHFDLFMVARMLGAAAAGHYSVAARLAAMLYLLPAAVGTLVFVTVPGLSQGSRDFAIRTARRVGIVLLPAALLAAVVASPLVRILFGTEFLPAVVPFQILLPGIVALGINTVFMQYFAGRGMPLFAVVAPAAAAVLNVALNLVLLPRLGIAGAAVASVIAYSVMLSSSIVYLGRTDA